MTQLSVAAEQNTFHPVHTGAGAVQLDRTPLRVFLVEDSKLYRDRLAEQLTFACKADIVDWADCESDAIAALRHVPWDLLILDLQLREGNGMGVLQALSGVQRMPNTKIIVLTDHDFYLYRRKALVLGADFYCVKGSDFNRVSRIVRDLVAKRNSMTQD